MFVILKKIPNCPAIYTNISKDITKITKKLYSSKANDKPDLHNNTSRVNPVAILVIKNLRKTNIDLYKKVLKNKGGIYSFVNTINGKQYIGSAFYLRLNEHLNNKKSNTKSF